MVVGTTGIKDTHTASLYELAFTATRSVSGHCCEVKQQRARLVAGWVTQALEQGRLGSCAHAGYHQYYIGDGSLLGNKLYPWSCVNEIKLTMTIALNGNYFNKSSLKMYL